ARISKATIDPPLWADEGRTCAPHLNAVVGIGKEHSSVADALNGDRVSSGPVEINMLVGLHPCALERRKVGVCKYGLDSGIVPGIDAQDIWAAGIRRDGNHRCVRVAVTGFDLMDMRKTWRRLESCCQLKLPAEIHSVAQEGLHGGWRGAIGLDLI